jgi:hypothetical protein
MYLLFSLVFENADLFPEYILISEIFKCGNHMRTLGAAQTGTGRDPSYWPDGAQRRGTNRTYWRR